MARRERRAYPQRSVRSEQRRQTAQSALARRVASLFGLACVAPQSQTTEVAEGNRGGWRAGEQAGMLLRRVLARPTIEATRGTWVFQQTPSPFAGRSSQQLLFRSQEIPEPILVDRLHVSLMRRDKPLLHDMPD